MSYSNNQFTKFKNLIAEPHTEVVTITANNGDGTSTGTTPAGVIVKIRGESITVGNNAFVKEGVVISSAPNLTITQVLI